MSERDAVRKALWNEMDRIGGGWNADNMARVAIATLDAYRGANAEALKAAFLRYEDTIKQRAMIALFYDDLAPYVAAQQEARRGLFALLGITEDRHEPR